MKNYKLPFPAELNKRSTSANVSSNTLFHFTNSIDNLLDILKNDFRPHFCRERFIENGKHVQEISTPMVSFCDLPLSLVKEHLTFYGCYGIGLSKDWGIENKISPVLYVHDKSPLYDFYRNLYSMSEINLVGENDKVIANVSNVMRDFSSYIKSYHGYPWRRGQYSKKLKRFYDEKEWRYVPRQEGNIFTTFLGMGFLLDGDVVDKVEKEMSKNHKLLFTPEDIHYIIVERENEILKMVEQIEKLKGKKYSWESVKMLTTKIISSERIWEDF